MEALTVIAKLEAKLGCEDELRAHLEEVARTTSEESGCARYAIHETVEDPYALVIVERWTSQQAFDQHVGSTHVQEFLSALPNLTVADPDVTVLRLIDYGSSEKGQV